MAELFREDNGKDTVAVYPDEDKLIEDIAAAYRQVIKDLYDAGCRNIQFDDCTWGMFCDKKYWEASQKDASVTFESEAEKYLRVNNLALQDRPEGFVAVTTIPHGPAVAAMRLLHRIFLPRKTLMRFIWNSMMNVPVISNRSSTFRKTRKSFWA